MSRLVPGLFLALFWLLLLLKGSFFHFWAVLVFVFVIGAYEYVKMTRIDKGVVSTPLLVLLILLPLLLSCRHTPSALAGGVVLSFFFLIISVILSFTNGDETWSFLSRSLFGVVYIGFLAAHLVLLRGMADGASWLIVLTTITAGSDAGAYYFGRSLGKRKLCHAVSPNKTLEGALGGTFTGTLGACIAGWLLIPHVSLLFLIPVSIVLVWLGIAGDLTESILKRATGVKDSGSLLAGHGGILDRCDSLLFAGPALYYLLLSLGGI